VPVAKGCYTAYTSPALTDKIIRDEERAYWKQMELITVFTIWKERCRQIFQEQVQQIPEVARKIFNELNSWVND
jgi:hypothetical protein